jgi:hypothetical protein
MNHRWNRFWLAVSVLMTLAVGLFAQTGQTPQPPPNIGTPHQIAVTGCLHRATLPNTYTITDETGTTWLLTSARPEIDLSTQVMRVVNVTGKELPADPEAKKSEPGSAPRTLRVLTLTTLSPSCTR